MALKRPSWSSIRLENIYNRAKTCMHTGTNTKSDTNLMCACACVCLCLCEGQVRVFSVVTFYRKRFDWKKASSILTNVCFWGANGVLMLVIGLFKTVAVCSCLSRTNAFHSHRHSYWPGSTLPQSITAFTGVIMKCLFHSHFFMSFPLPLCLHLSPDNRMIKVNGTREPLEFKSHQWFGASVRTHKGKVVVSGHDVNKYHTCVAPVSS